jgi:lipoate---protein ligase
MLQLRVIDAGTVSPRRSQALWHGLAETMGEDASPTLSFCRPADPYVCLGLHRSLTEVDLGVCESRGLPVFRRQIGGGPVYLDSDQLFFQITLPTRQAPARVDKLYEKFLAPAVEAFRALGLAAELDGLNDIVVDSRKISGTGAGQIESAVTVVGNVIFRFPHEQMADILAVPTETMRQSCLHLMRRYVTSFHDEGLRNTTESDAIAALTTAYASALNASPSFDEPTQEEYSCIEEWERRLDEAEWLGQSNREPGEIRTVKVSSRAWVFSVGDEDLCVEATIVAGEIERARLQWSGSEGPTDELKEMEDLLRGFPAESASVKERLRKFGPAGLQIANLLTRGFASTTH